jgi:hypothetical protein
MSYPCYGLEIKGFEAVDNALCLAEMIAADPDIGSCAFFDDNNIEFELGDVEDECDHDSIVATCAVIARHLKPGQWTELLWRDEDGHDFGCLVGRNTQAPLRTMMVADTEYGVMSVEEARQMLSSGRPPASGQRRKEK